MQAKLVTESALERKQVQCLIERGVGTIELEQAALSLNQDKSEVKISKRDKVNIRLIQQQRNSERVVDLLKLRLKYCQKKEEALRGQYRHLSSEATRIFAGKTGKLKRIIKITQRETTKSWNKGLKRIEQKADWLERKFAKHEIRTETQSENFEEWLTRISKGSGRNRVKLNVEIPVFGEIQFDQDELQVLKLNPKYRLFPKVTKSDVRKNMKIQTLGEP